ncbi:type II toxin-antitoxin system RelE/ParE family toxin, partial [Alcanivorax sp. HI0083]
SEAARLLADHPEMGREGVVPGTRELFPHEHYRLVYEVYQEAVWVLTLVHTARLWPKPMSDKDGAPD